MLENCAPIFVVGPARSGTTLIRWILDTHPRIVCRSEQNFLHAFVVCFQDTFLKSPAGDRFDRDQLKQLRKWYDLTAEEGEIAKRFRAFHESFYADLALRQRKQRWADNTHAILDFHIAAMDLIYRHTPSYVMIVRHGLDCAVSAMERFPTQSFDESFRYWASVVNLHRAFADAHPSRCLRITYEQLIAEPQTTTNSIFEFLNENESVDIRNVFLRDHGPRFGDPKIHNTDSFHASSVGKWANVPRSLYARLLDTVPQFKDEMNRCGYAYEA
jgi:hypothetical protein